MGLEPRAKADAPTGQRFPFVLFAAPPSGSADYPGDVAAAAQQLWEGPSGGGAFVFTSSNSVCEVQDGGLVTEETTTVAPGAGASTDKLLGAEAAALQVAGGLGGRGVGGGAAMALVHVRICEFEEGGGGGEGGSRARLCLAGLRANSGSRPLRPRRGRGRPFGPLAPTCSAPPLPPSCAPHHRQAAAWRAWWACTTPSGAPTPSS